MDKAAVLRQRLGIDIEAASSFRTSMVGHEASTGALASTIEAQLALINASPFVKKTLSSGDVYVHTIEAASSRFIADRYAFLSESTLRNLAEDAKAGIAFLTDHNEATNPYGRTFNGIVEQKDGRLRTLMQLYMLRDHRPNGNNAASTDDLDKGLSGGTLFDVSVGLTRGDGSRLVCDVCSLDLVGSDCQHFPGSKDNMSAGDIAKQQGRGVSSGCATVTFENYRGAEVSAVFNGALPGAGTAFSTSNPPVEKTAPVREEETTMKYSAELKIQLGLSAEATDTEVETKLASLKSAAAGADKAIADLKKISDEAFASKWTEKLGAEIVAELSGLANRDAIAEKMAGKVAAGAPPMGDPLKGAALSSAPAASTATPESEAWRKGFGIFASDEELTKKALTTPMEATARLLGLKTLNPTAAHSEYDQMVVANRKQIFGIA